MFGGCEMTVSVPNDYFIHINISVVSKELVLVGVWDIVHGSCDKVSEF